VRERRNERGKEKKNVKKRGKGENEVYLLLRRIICVVSLCCLTDGMRDIYIYILCVLILTATCCISVVEVYMFELLELHFQYQVQIWPPAP
jgi:hypothetical protein